MIIHFLETYLYSVHNVNSRQKSSVFVTTLLQSNMPSMLNRTLAEGLVLWVWFSMFDSWRALLASAALSCKERLHNFAACRFRWSSWLNICGWTPQPWKRQIHGEKPGASGEILLKSGLIFTQRPHGEYPQSKIRLPNLISLLFSAMPSNVFSQSWIL